MQSPVCPPNELLSFGKTLQYTMYQVFTKFYVGVKKNSASENRTAQEGNKSADVVGKYEEVCSL